MSRFVRALLFATCVYSFLSWAYIAFRVVIGDLNPLDPFIIGIPIPFYALGVASFLISYASMVIYLTIWGFDGKS